MEKLRKGLLAAEFGETDAEIQAFHHRLTRRTRLPHAAAQLHGVTQPPRQRSHRHTVGRRFRRDQDLLDRASGLGHAVVSAEGDEVSDSAGMVLGSDDGVATSEEGEGDDSGCPDIHRWSLMLPAQQRLGRSEAGGAVQVDIGRLLTGAAAAGLVGSREAGTRRRVFLSPTARRWRSVVSWTFAQPSLRHLPLPLGEVQGLARGGGLGGSWRVEVLHALPLGVRGEEASGRRASVVGGSV